jgi:adenine/guanine/hypoxanthine permease
MWAPPGSTCRIERMTAALRRLFKLDQAGTTFSREIVAGITTFVTMSYIIVVNPAVLSIAGIPAEASMVATILICIFGCLLMGLWANRPFAIGPYMGENAFIAFTVVQVLHFTWQQALGAVLIAGLIFILMTVFRLRQFLVDAVPSGLRYSFAVGIGLFLTFIGLNQTGIVMLGVSGAPVKTGELTSLPVLVAIVGFMVMTVLVIRRVPGAILISIVATAFLAFALHVANAPAHWVSMPPSIRPILFQVDLRGALSWAFFPVVLTIFIMAFVDTMGTLIGLSARAGFLDANGNLPQIERPMLADALSTTVAALIGTTTSGAYVESATGIEAGGRTGLTSVVTAGCFALALFFSPFAAAIPKQAYGPALIMVGSFMLAPVAKIKFDEMSEVLPAFVVIALMIFTYNIGVGITAGFVLYPFCKLVTGRAREVKTGLWVLAGLSLLFFVFYPYT